MGIGILNLQLIRLHIDGAGDPDVLASGHRRSDICEVAETAARVKFNLMRVGGLRTYISFERIGDRPSR
jgi:hypothetical protein